MKIVRTTQETEDDEDNLPPPSPPPGSPPPHLFPPRAKIHSINNVHPNFAPAIINLVASYRPPLPSINVPPPSSLVTLQSVSQLPQVHSVHMHNSLVLPVSAHATGTHQFTGISSIPQHPPPRLNGKFSQWRN